MLPLAAPEDAAPRLAALAREYGARELIVLGDVVHRAVPLEPVRAQLREFCAALGSVPRLRLLGGNHDRGLERLLARGADAAAGWRNGEGDLHAADSVPRLHRGSRHGRRDPVYAGRVLSRPRTTQAIQASTITAAPIGISGIRFGNRTAESPFSTNAAQ